ncbi:cell division protein ZapE [Allopseudospirillum japonicum]|uniref:Cell division protein ZapE n=1 Tax=Allopseudospirillum japonicum TaxID=64971 RepID=A0A1H6QN15_9GAMM|nr:cell division protein ZapE [Allopseudospirillum japonicum]SEI40850.1 cell division protein ZapE [Allopseudospirillum japonicum]
MTPLERYQQDLQRNDFSYDAAQENAVKHLQRLYDELLSTPPGGKVVTKRIQLESQPKKGLFSKLLGTSSGAREKIVKSVEPIKGLYFWGGVGRGKTYLVDTFYESLPFPEKSRTHFHRFMQRVHAELRRYDGERNPLKLVADTLAKEARVICFDEFFVKDITDAMILANLLEALFERGVVLVTTSNIVPDELYKDGLQRARFLPAIDLLNQHTEIVNVDSGIDYRLRALTQAEIFHTPLDAAADVSLQTSFDAIALATGDADIALEINYRIINAKRCHDDVAWFEFDELCDGPRSQNDYIELSKLFHTVLIANVPQMGRDKDDQARRFINMIDEFYDRNVKVIMSAAAPITDLYTQGNLNFEFERTVSRLLEMQSHEYLAREHKP